MSPVRALLAPIAADVRRRQGLAIAAALAIGQWMIRSHPPWYLRELAWLATPEQRAPWTVGALAAVLMVSRSLAKRLLCAREIRHLRHLPIAARTWRWIHGTQLLALDLPLHAAALYGVWPLVERARTRSDGIAWVIATIASLFAARVLACALIDRRVHVRLASGALVIGCGIVVLVIADAWLACGLAAVAAALAVHRLGRPFPEPRGRFGLALRLPHPMLARAWLQLSCAWHRDRVHLSTSIAVQAGAIVLGAIAAAHVPEDARWTVGFAACCAAAMALWSAVRSERALADDRWVLDPLVGARAIDLGGRIIAAAVLALPLLLATVVVLADHGAPWHALGSAFAAVVWTAAVAVELVTRAEARRTLRRPQVLTIALRVAIAIPATLVLGSVGLLVHALVAAQLAARRWQLADLTRRRFARLPGEIEAAVS